MDANDGLEQLLDRIDTRKVLKRVIVLGAAMIRHDLFAKRARKAQKHHAAEWTTGRLMEAQAREKAESKLSSAARRELLKLIKESIASQEMLFTLVEPAEETV